MNVNRAPKEVPLRDNLSEIVLIVDVIPENLSLLHDALDETGYTVLVATNGESALQRARLSLPDVILLAALMPGMDGFEVARRLKADFATQHIPIVFMTGLTETEHVVAAFAAGGADYVTKPIRPPEVLARIAAHMMNARQMKQARSALDAFGQATVAVRAVDGKAYFGPRYDMKMEPAAHFIQMTLKAIAACWLLFTIKPAMKNGWLCCARRTMLPPSNH